MYVAMLVISVTKASMFPYIYIYIYIRVRNFEMFMTLWSCICCHLQPDETVVWRGHLILSCSDSFTRSAVLVTTVVVKPILIAVSCQITFCEIPTILHAFPATIAIDTVKFQ